MVEASIIPEKAHPPITRAVASRILSLRPFQSSSMVQTLSVRQALQALHGRISSACKCTSSCDRREADKTSWTSVSTFPPFWGEALIPSTFGFIIFLLSPGRTQR